jgi:glutaredoxin 2
VVPILEYEAEDGSRICHPESMDIVKRIDEDKRFGAPILKVNARQEDTKCSVYLVKGAQPTASSAT